jgi:hypothetical protein
MEPDPRRAVPLDAIIRMRGVAIGRCAGLWPFNDAIPNPIIQHDDRGERDRTTAEVRDRFHS